jgi:hypothetical protein
MVGLFLGGLALGALSNVLRGPPWLALLFPLLPGAVWSLTTSAADGLAVALSLVVVVAALQGRSALACVAAVAAVLTKETSILVPLALVLARRRREDLTLLVIPAVALAAWLLVVRLGVPAGGVRPEGLVVPFTGLLDALRDRWLHGKELVGMASTVCAGVLGAVVLLRRRGPVELRWVIGLQLAFLAFCSGDVLGNDFGSTRSTLMLLTVAVAGLLAGSHPPAAAPAEPYRASTSARNLPV